MERANGRCIASSITDITRLYFLRQVFCQRFVGRVCEGIGVNSFIKRPPVMCRRSFCMAVLKYQMIEVHSSILVSLSLENLIRQKNSFKSLLNMTGRLCVDVNHWNEYVKLVT